MYTRARAGGGGVGGGFGSGLATLSQPRVTCAHVGGSGPRRGASSLDVEQRGARRTTYSLT